MSENHEYDQGVRDSRLKALEESKTHFTRAMENHERRLVIIERIIYGMVGVLFLSSIWPKLAEMLNAFK